MRLARLAPRVCGLVAGTLVLRGGGADAQSIEDIVREEVYSSRPAIVLVLHYDGQVQFSGAYGSTGGDPDAPISMDALFPYPALTEILLGIAIEALDAGAVVDQEAPIATLMPGLSEMLGGATLRQLVTSTAGLDDAGRIEGETWERTLDRLDDAALAAPPGTFYSRSKHTLPLAARVLAGLFRRPFVDVASAVAIDQLGLAASTFDLSEARARGLVVGVEQTEELASFTRTVEAADTLDGLPVLFTTAPDAVAILSAWTEGRLRGRGPAEIAGPDPVSPGSARRFGAGVFVDRFRGLSHVSRTQTAFGVSTELHLLPEVGATILVWSRGFPATRVALRLLDAVADAVGAEAAARPPATTEAGPEPDPTRWAGTYRNGDLIWELRESSGRLTLFDGSQDLALEPVDATGLLARLADGRAAFRLDLLSDDRGRRYLNFGGVLYRHEDDGL